MAAVLKELLDSFISMALLLVVAAVMGFYPSARLLAAPLVMAGIGLAGFAVGLPLACILVPLRDVRQVLQIVLQVWMYATPIIYNPAIVPESLRFYFQLNPMYWAVEIFRWILLDQPLDLTLVPLLSCAGILVVLAAGLCVFLFCERVAIDVK
jgi:lipopolysaccharide transport system permease protein